MSSSSDEVVDGDGLMEKESTTHPLQMFSATCYSSKAKASSAKPL
jgi:hypothetical protein